MFKNGLTHRVSIYVPSTRDVNVSTDTSAYVENTLRFLAKRFGGATAQSARGAWVSENDDLVTEGVTIVYAYSETLTPDDYAAIYAHCEKLRDELSQEAIACEIDGELHFT